MFKFNYDTQSLLDLAERLENTSIYLTGVLESGRQALMYVYDNVGVAEDFIENLTYELNQRAQEYREQAREQFADEFEKKLTEESEPEAQHKAESPNLNDIVTNFALDKLVEDQVKNLMNRFFGK